MSTASHKHEDAPAPVAKLDPARSTAPDEAIRPESTSGYDSREMAARGRIGGYRTHSLHDSRQITAPARRAFLARFEHEVDPDGELDPAERSRRAEAAKRAHFARLARKSARARRARSGTART